MKKSFYKNYFKMEKEHWLMIIRRMIVKDNMDIYLNKNKITKILDFGCGSGILVDELAKQGYQTYGLDNHKDAIKFGLLQGVKNIKVIDTYKINFQDNTFDAVFSLDVLEHIYDEKQVLNEIIRVLKPGGIVIIMVPAYMFLWGIQDKISNHYRRYTISSLLKKINKITFVKVLKMSYFNTFLFLPIAFLRIINRIFGINRKKSDFNINNYFLNKFFFYIFNFERKILKYINFPFGVSILFVLKKENN